MHICSYHVCSRSFGTILSQFSSHFILMHGKRRYVPKTLYLISLKVNFLHADTRATGENPLNMSSFTRSYSRYF